MAKEFLASYYADKIGYKGDNLYDGNSWYCENDNLLGGLPYKHILKITYKGKTSTGIKGDIGKCGPRKIPIDLHKSLAKRIGFPYTVDRVTIKGLKK